MQDLDFALFGKRVLGISGRKRSGRSGWMGLAVTGTILLAAGRQEAHAQAFTQVVNPVEGTREFPGMDSGNVAWGDYTGDGRPDFFACGSDDGPTSALLYRNKGDGTFIEDTTASANLVPVSTFSSWGSAWGDFDNDGDLDLVVTGTDFTFGGSTRLYRNDGPDGTGNTLFTNLGDRGMIKVTDSSVVFLDANLDGRQDLFLIGTQQSRLYYGDGAGNFSHVSTALFQGLDWCSAAAADYDRDGDPDLFIAGADLTGGFFKRAILYRNNGDGTFSVNSQFTPTPVDFASVAWGDYDHDGWPDLALSGRTDSDVITKVYHNNQDHTFTESASLDGVAWSSVAWGDYDNDGLLDLAVSGGGVSNIFNVYRNTGSGFSLVSPSGLTPMRTCGIGWADYDGDGDLDLLQNGVDDSAGLKKMLLYRNNTSGTNIPPSVPAGLNSVVDQLSVTFSWNPSTDDHTPQDGLTYNLVVGTSSGAFDTLVSSRVPGPGNTGGRVTHTLHNLTNGQIYYWTVQAVDSSFLASPFSLEAVTATVPVALSAFSAE